MRAGVRGRETQPLDAERPPDWSPVSERGAPALAGVVLRALLAGVAAAGLWVLGHRPAAVVLLGAAALITAASLLLPSVATRIERVTGAVERIVGRALALVLLGAVQLLVFTPVSLLLRLLRRDPLAPGRSHDSETFWHPRPELQGRSLYRRPFAYERMPSPTAGRGHRRPSLLRFRAVVGLVALVALADVGLGAVLHALADEAPVDQASLLRFPDAAAGRHEPWRVALGREVTRVAARRRFDPYLGWKTSHFDGRYVHVAGGVRRSYQPAGGLSATAPAVFFFGGSAMFGGFQRDEHTIPSEFARLAEADGVRIRVVNYGRLAYVNWQEVQLLQQLVTAGRRPDLAVFYDGFNEILSQFQEGPHSTPSNVEARAIEDRLRGSRQQPPLEALYDSWAGVSALHRLFAPGHTASPWKGDQARRPGVRGRLAASVYMRGVQLARHLGASYGFRTAFLWQPSLYSKRLRAGERRLLGAFSTQPRAWRLAGDAARSALAAPVSDLSGALDSVPGPVMYDLVHINEQGARAVARTLYDRLRPTLHALETRAHR